MPSWAKWAVSMLVAVGLIWIGWRFTAVLVTLHVLVCFVLVIVIMLQSGNAADLAGAFGGAGSQTAFGPRGAATFLSRATTWCAIVFMMTSLTLSVKRAPADATLGTGSVLEQTEKPAPAGSPRRRRRIRRCKRQYSRRQDRLLGQCQRRARIRIQRPLQRRIHSQRPRNNLEDERAFGGSPLLQQRELDFSPAEEASKKIVALATGIRRPALKRETKSSVIVAER